MHLLTPLISFADSIYTYMSDSGTGAKLNVYDNEPRIHLTLNRQRTPVCIIFS